MIVTLGVHTWADESYPDATTTVYIGREACADHLGETVSDPADAESEEVVGYTHATPAETEDGEAVWETTLADGVTISVGGVECQVGTHDYQDDGLAVAEIRRV